MASADDRSWRFPPPTGARPLGIETQHRRRSCANALARRSRFREPIRQGERRRSRCPRSEIQSGHSRLTQRERPGGPRQAEAVKRARDHFCSWTAARPEGSGRRGSNPRLSAREAKYSGGDGRPRAARTGAAMRVCAVPQSSMSPRQLIWTSDVPEDPCGALPAGGRVVCSERCREDRFKRLHPESHAERERRKGRWSVGGSAAERAPKAARKRESRSSLAASVCYGSVSARSRASG